MKKSFGFFFFALLLLASCTKESPAPQILEIDGLSYVHTIPLEYATAFRADVYSADFILLTILGTDRYLLVPPNCAAPQNLPPDIKLIQLPIQNAYLCASSAMSLFSALDSLDSIRFSSIQKRDWYIEEAARAMENGAILYAGKYNAPDFELLLSENCSLAIESTMIYHAPAILEKLESLGITVFVEKSSYEEHPLGRLEWVKVYGLLTGKFSEAEAFFDAQIDKVSRFASLARNDIGNDGEISSPKIMSFFYVTPSGMAVIRGSDDYIVKMIELAGGAYAFLNTKKSKSPSIQISMEEFYAKAADSDILIYNSSIDNSIRSKQDLIQKNPLFAEFKAVKSGEVWATGSYIYQATDKIGDMILDLHAILLGHDDDVEFLQKVE